jgi:hypothetical protein
MTEAPFNQLIDSTTDLRLIRRIANESADAIYELWDPDRGCYWRDTEQRRRNKSADPHEFFPTVTYRSIEALLDLIFHRPDWLRDEQRTAIIKEYLPKIFERSLVDTQSALDIGGSRFRNPFTTALYIITAIRANKIVKPGPDVVSSTDIEAAMQELLKACRERGSPYSSKRHPFIEFHLIRALLTSTSFIGVAGRADITLLRGEIIDSVKAETEELLAKKMLNQLTPSDSVALVFCAAALAFGGTADDRHFVLPALSAGFEAQDTSGCWPLGRIIRRNTGKRGQRAWDFMISTYEIAWAASETLLKLLRQRQAVGEVALSTLDRLLLAGQYAGRSSVELSSENPPPRRGWCSDPPYGQLQIESWTSANVLQSIISLNEVIEERVCNETLKTFVSLDPRNEDWPSWKRWDKLIAMAEPEDNNRIIEYLDQKIVKPIKNHPRRLPSSKDETVSVLLFGPPGTSKTTLVHGMADGLGWPIVMLSPGDFIDKGLEFIEAQMRQVFERLQKLHRVVVLFDECDELFRDRQPSNATEPMRNITAFVTASVLPKLQDLHDRGRVLFCICTNKFGTLDPAVKRGGRVDHVVAVGPPQKDARERIIKESLSEVTGPKDVPIAQLVMGTEGFVRREIIRTCEVVLSNVADWTDTDEVSDIVTKAVERVRQSRMITDDEYDEFRKDKQQFSHPVIQG